LGPSLLVRNKPDAFEKRGGIVKFPQWAAQFEGTGVLGKKPATYHHLSEEKGGFINSSRINVPSNEFRPGKGGKNPKREGRENHIAF